MSRAGSARWRLVAIAALGAVATLAAGCFDSLVGAPCADGFVMVGGACVDPAAPDADGADTSGPPPDAGPPPDSAPVCAAPMEACGGACVDTSSSADDCGACGHACPGGRCAAGQCESALQGHVLAIDAPGR